MTTARPVTVTELGADAAGDVLYFIVDNGTSFRVDQLVFGDLVGDRARHTSRRPSCS